MNLFLPNCKFGDVPSGKTFAVQPGGQEGLVISGFIDDYAVRGNSVWSSDVDNPE